MLDIPVEPKFAEEKVVFTFNFADELGAGETLVAPATCSIEIVRGTDPNAAGMINGSAQISVSTAQVLQSIQAGVRGTRYRVKCVAPTSNAGKVLARAYVIDIE